MSTVEVPIIKPKRGRKPKAVAAIQDTENVVLVVVEEKETNAEQTNTGTDNTNTVIADPVTENDIIENATIKPGIKKRGRKPKGGKIIQQIVPLNSDKEIKPNVILHLKCSVKDLDENHSTSLEHLESFNFSSGNNGLGYEEINSVVNVASTNDPLNYNPNTYNDFFSENKTNLTITTSTSQTQKNNSVDQYDSEDDKTCVDNKEVYKKLKQLEHNLHLNLISDKKSACFWCTCDFDTQPIYIPKHFIKDSYNVYGCFCSPECATAYLMEENIDSSTKFERYHLLNHIYCKVFNYTKNIKPAPNPYYMLNKFYGNLTIQEYRALLKSERLFLVVDKPLTRILPELHEDNDDFIINNKIIPSNNYQIKKKLQRKLVSKANILSEKFGMNPSTF